MLALVACQSEKNMKDQPQTLSPSTASMAIDSLKALYGEGEVFRITRGVEQAAAFWQPVTDGNDSAFLAFCREYYVPEGPGLELLHQRLSGNFEVLWGSFNKISLKLQEPVQLEVGDILPVDRVFAGYAAGAHLNDDLFANKVAFITLLNFPFYTLEEKKVRAAEWTRCDWAFARMGEVFTSRVPAALLQEYSRVNTAADAYISEYNIYMHNLRKGDGAPLFPEGLRLITHWGLRDELKANYADPDGLEKQRMIYQVMLDIIRQQIPGECINNPEVVWDPYTCKVLSHGKWTGVPGEGDVRYRHLLEQFRALKAMDKYNPLYPDYIKRKFDQGMEIPQVEVEALFTELVSHPVVRECGRIISQRLGRPLEPFDIWYDGFKARSGVAESRLDAITRARYPHRDAFQQALPDILRRMGFNPADATRLSAQIQVDPSRGAGHAWGAEMRTEKARLRTRIGPDGMDYKGYNIAIHEFGHTVEQTISLHEVDYYLLNGVPNTSFTEALAFVFQKQDLAMLGMEDKDPLKEQLSALDHLWSNYEIMGVSLVDMKLWQWLYAQEDEVRPAQLREEVVRIATEVWNAYYAPVFGVRDSPILAVYSHMIDYPLYLSAYPIGELIQFQIEHHLRQHTFAPEVLRMYRLGRLSPAQWMKEAVGGELSILPLVNAAESAVAAVGKP